MQVRWTVYALLWALVSTLGGCAGTPSHATIEERQTLAPTGSLRVALYTGTPTSVISEHDLRGVGYELGRELARRLGVPFQPLVFPKNADVQDAIKTGRADIAFTNATAERAKQMDFTEPYLIIELGYIARGDGPVATLADVDRPGVRVGVTAGSTTDVLLSHDLKFAQLIRLEAAAVGVQMLAADTIDVYATNKATLFEMADKLSGAKVLDGSWGTERHALAVPKGRDRGLPFVRAFVADAIADGLVKAAADKAGVRGAVVAGSSP